MWADNWCFMLAIMRVEKSQLASAKKPEFGPQLLCLTNPCVKPFGGFLEWGWPQSSTVTQVNL